MAYSNKDFAEEMSEARKPAKKIAAKKPLPAEARKKLPTNVFALPGRKYPIHDKAHARNALARVAQNGTPAEKARVRAAVKRRFPSIA